ncbi:MAG: hypothetical protein LIR25_02180 [bacterium]|nr:hypothetical protein [Spirochaetales bacterium]MDT3389394.1 hypothetical protein [bacterium]
MNVLIFGYVPHGGGFESAMYFLSRGDSVTITDIRSRSSLGESLDYIEKQGAVIHCGGHLTDDFLNADLVVKSPTIKLDNEFLSYSKRTESDLSYASYRPEIKQVKMICVTGSRNKTVTTSSLCHALNVLGHKTHMCGNMGLTAFSELRNWDNGDIPEYLIIEMSSWVARDTYTFLGENVPHVAVSVITSPFGEAGSEEISLGECTGEFNVHADHIICPASVKDTIGKLAHKKAKNVSSIESASKGLSKALPEKMRASYAVLRKLGFSSSDINNVLKSFRGIPGRGEMVLRTECALYVNDSSSLIPAATGFTMENFVNLPVHLICGGSDSSLDAEGMLGALKAAASIHLLDGSFTATRLMPLLKSKRIKFSGPYKEMEEAVSSASSRIDHESRLLQVILLSPGSSAFEQFGNEFNRGESFRNAVLSRQDH